MLLDLPVETVVGLQGQVYLDENRNGQRDEGEAPVPYARVRLQGPEARTALADGRGSFVVGGLLPGRYTLSLDLKSLGRLQEPGDPLVLDLEPGPLPQVALAARPVVREVVRTLTEKAWGWSSWPSPRERSFPFGPRCRETPRRWWRRSRGAPIPWPP